MGAAQSQSVSLVELGQSIRSLAARVDSSFDFFDRREELERLVRILDAAPLQVTALLGPKDSGKSLLLTHLRGLWNASVGRCSLAPLFILDMRLNDCSSPQAMAELLKREFGGWQQGIRTLLSSMGSGDVMGIPARELAQGIASFWESMERVSGTGALAAVQGIVWRFLEQHPFLKPVIIIDEANKLAKWEGVYDKELDDLLSFVEGITKQTGRAHVIMASSDEFFRNWLRTKFLDGKVKVIGLGHFSEGEAKHYFSQHVAPTLGLTLPQDWETSLWPTVFGAAGGSAYQLKTLVMNACVEDGDAAANLTEQAGELVGLARINLESALGANEGWSEAQLTGILKAIVDGGGAVPYTAVVGKRSNAYGNSVVQSLVRKNIVHVRLLTKSGQYKDFPAHYTEVDEYLMATSPAAFAAMKILAIE